MEIAMSENIIYLNDENYKSTVEKGVTLVDFYADWCGPCRAIAPVIEELANELKGQVVVAKLDIDKAQKATSEFQVTSIPTIILFRDGQERKRIVGLKDKASLKKLIAEV